MKDLNRSGKGQLIAFAGSTPNIGATLIGFGAACLLSHSLPALSVGYVCLNLKSSKLHRYLGCDDAPNSLDGIRAELRARSLTGGRLLGCCHRLPAHPQLHVLFGNMLREQADFYMPDDIEHMLDAARRTFDICFVDVSAYWDNAATIGAMREGDMRVIVTTPELTHFQDDLQRGLHTVGPMFGITPERTLLVVNRSEKSSVLSGIRPADIAKEAGLELAAVVPRYGDLLDPVNRGRAAELWDGRHPLRESLQPLVARLTDELGVERGVPARRGAWLNRLLTGASAQ